MGTTQSARRANVFERMIVDLHNVEDLLREGKREVESLLRLIEEKAPERGEASHEAIVAWATNRVEHIQRAREYVARLNKADEGLL